MCTGTLRVCGPGLTAKLAVIESLPEGWEEGQAADGRMLYINQAEGSSTEEHPLDEYFKDLLERERAKRAPYYSSQSIWYKENGRGNRSLSALVPFFLEPETVNERNVSSRWRVFAAYPCFTMQVHAAEARVEWIRVEPRE